MMCWLGSDSPDWILEHLNSGEISVTGCDRSIRLHSCTWTACFQQNRAKGKGKVKGKSKDKGGGSRF